MKNFLTKAKQFLITNWIYITIFAGFLILDQISKLLLDGKVIPLISGVFSLTSSHNYGAGFSILTGKGWLLIVLTLLFLAGIAVYNHFQKNKNALYRWSMALIVSGAVGNLIDRIFIGYVRDFLYFELINFPIFNVADSCLTIGIILLCVFLLFVEPKIRQKQSENNSQQCHGETQAQLENIENNDNKSQKNTEIHEKSDEKLEKK